MTRSNITTKFTIHTVGEFSKSYAERYKRENEEKFKGNVLDDITLGVIRKKRLPDVTDVFTLVKLGNIKITDEQAEAIIERELANERTLVDIFCDCCSDLAIDIPLSKEFKEQLINLHETIDKQQAALNSMNDLVNQLAKLGENLKNSLSEKDNTSEEVTETSEEVKETSEKVETPIVPLPTAAEG